MSDVDQPGEPEDEAVWADIMAQPATRGELLDVLTKTHIAILANAVLEAVSGSDAPDDQYQRTVKSAFEATTKMTDLMRKLVNTWAGRDG